MKKLPFLLVLSAALFFTACKDEKKADNADTTTQEKVDDPSKAAESAKAFAVKAHACIADCKDGNHVYAHGDLGHSCTDDCGAAHACTEQCSTGAHVYAHGESGHTCTEDCLKL